jgi:hypothetical protein
MESQLAIVPNDDPASLHPYTAYSKICPKCNTASLKAPMVCKGNGEHITNWGRRFQPVSGLEVKMVQLNWAHQCENSDCNHFLWHNPPTPLEKIPFNVQLRFSIKQSAKDDGDGSIPCPGIGCLTAKNEPRKANRGCTQSAGPHCNICCGKLGGCNLTGHRRESFHIFIRL